jgi:hypothetical protein
MMELHAVSLIRREAKFVEMLNVGSTDSTTWVSESASYTRLIIYGVHGICLRSIC